MVDTGSRGLILYCASIPFHIIGLIGNVLVIRIVQKTPQMHTPTNYLLVSMAVSDVITILLYPLWSFTENRLGYVSDKFATFVWKAFVPLMAICITVSSVTLTVLAVERYHALLKPFRTELQLSDHNVKKAIAFIWAASILLCFPHFFFAECSQEHSVCVGPLISDAEKIFILVRAIIFFMQWTIIVACYGSLIRGLYFTNTVCPDTDGTRSLEKKKLVVTFLLATAGFFVGYAPQTVFMTVVACASRDDIENHYSNVYSATQFLFVCSLCFNPPIYAFRSSSYRQGFKRLLACKTLIQDDIEVR